MDEFLGLRYAQPPVGQYRWRPPRPLDDGPCQPNTIILANDYGPICPQPGADEDDQVGR